MDIRTPRDASLIVRGRRHDLGWSQAELASRTKVSRRLVSDFETGKTSPDLGTVLRLIDALGLTVAIDLIHTSRAGHAVDLDDVLGRYLTR
jgi:HTH-type transcriptional regulator / antitoxin HipB